MQKEKGQMIHQCLLRGSKSVEQYMVLTTKTNGANLASTQKNVLNTSKFAISFEFMLMFDLRFYFIFRPALHLQMLGDEYSHKALLSFSTGPAMFPSLNSVKFESI